MKLAEVEYCVFLRSALLDPGLNGDFDQFAERLYKANKVMNLTRVAREECWNRHFYDSLLFGDLIPQDASVLDIGTGPGFPAWPLARARPDLQVTALDSSGKMLGFLAGSPLPNLRLVQARAEEFSERESFDVVTGRALAPLAVQLEVSAAFANLGGLVLPMRSEKDLPEILRFPAGLLGLKLESVEGRILEGGDAKRLFPLYRKAHATPKRFPRKWADIKSMPL